MSEFGRAFAAARRAGKKTFLWKGRPIAVRLADDKIAGTTSKERSIIADAIGVAENDKKRLGVRSVKANSLEGYRRIRRRSIENNLKRWEKAGKPGKFVDFMWKRWAPIGAKNDPNGLNENWGGNVRGALKKRLGKEKYEEWKRRNLVYLSPTARAIKMRSV